MNTLVQFFYVDIFLVHSASDFCDQYKKQDSTVCEIISEAKQYFFFFSYKFIISPALLK